MAVVKSSIQKKQLCFRSP